MQTNKERFITALQEPLETTFATYKTSALGLVDDQVEENRDIYGENVITKGQEDSMIKKIYESIINPFTVILLVIALVSFITNVWLAKPGEQDPTTSIIIVTLVLISGGIRFIQELRSDKAASNLSRMIVNTATVLRDGSEQEIPIDEIVVGDVIKLSAGDMIPADVVLIDSRDFFVQQSGLTGESDAVEKVCLRKADSQNLDSLLESESLAFMGTNVISGRATALVLVVGDETMMGAIEQTINTYDEPTSFEREMNTISWLLIRLMLVMVPVVFVINGLTDGDWLEAGVFALSVGVGLTPEMLPMIITASLAKGSIIMAQEKVVIKKLNAIQDLGAIDILCTDKTGTLTQDEIVLEYPLDIHGDLDLAVLRRAFLNSYYQTGLKNLMDRAIINRTEKEAEKHEIVRNLDQTFKKIDELPFDFERRRMSVIVKDDEDVISMVTKGALEEMLAISSHVEYKKRITELTEEIRQEILAEVAQLNEQGLRVLGVSYKSDLEEDYDYEYEEEPDPNGLEVPFENDNRRSAGVSHRYSEYSNQSRGKRKTSNRYSTSGTTGNVEASASSGKTGKTGRNNPGKTSRKRKKAKWPVILLSLLVVLCVYGGWSFLHRATGYWNIAVFGVDSRDGNTKNALADVQLICSINQETGEIKLVSVYRDTYLKIDSKGTYHKINEAF